MPTRRPGLLLRIWGLLAWVVVLSPQAVRAIDAAWTPDAAGLWSDATLWSSNPQYPNSAEFDVSLTSGAPFLDQDYTIGDFTWIGGAVEAAPDEFFVRSLTVTGPATLSGPGQMRIADARIDLRGDTFWSGGELVLDAEADARHRTHLDVGENALFDMQFDGLLGKEPGLTPVMIVAGTLQKSGGEGAAVIDPRLMGGGTVHVQSGQLHFRGGSAWNGEMLVDEGAVVQFSDSPDSDPSIDSSSRIWSNGQVSGAGLVRFGHLEGHHSNPAIEGALDAAAVEFDPGESGHVFVTSTATLGATMRGSLSVLSGGVSIRSAAAHMTDLTLDNANLSILEGGHLRIQGNASMVGGVSVQLGDYPAGGSMTFDGEVPQHLSGDAQIVMSGDSVLEAVHSLVIDSGVTIHGIGEVRGGAAGGVLHGVIAPSNGPSLGGTIVIANMTIAPGGVAETGPAGRIELASTWHNDGLLRVADGRTLVMGGTFGVDDIGVIERGTTALVELNGTLQNVGTTLDLETTTGTLHSYNSTIVGGRIESSGASQLVVRSTATKLIGVTLAVDVSAFLGGTVAVENGLTLDQATVGAGLVVWPGSQTIGGVGEILGGVGGGNIVEDEITIGPGITVRGGLDGGTSPSRRMMINRGTVQSGTASSSLTLRRAINDGGLIHALGTKTINFSMISTGLTEFVQTAGEIRIAALGRGVVQGGALAIRGGVLSGGGTVLVSASNNPDPFVRVTNGGTIAPGDSIGVLTIDGNLAIGDGGRLAVEIAGASADQLRVIRVFQTLPGNLDLSSSNDYLDVTQLEPATAPWYVIATYAGALTGQFDHVTPGYSVAYDTVQRRVYSNVAQRADFDYDGDVDGRDMLIWQRNVGVAEGASRLQGDANHDGAVDAADLALWQSQLGTSAPLFVAVPEPRGKALILLGILRLVRRRGRSDPLPGVAGSSSN
jgi:hypothetical protein